MELTFNPALTILTTVPVASNHTVHVRFTAGFSSRDAYERARDEDLRIEMWTDLPTSNYPEGWHALRFKYAEETSSTLEDGGMKVLSLVPSTATPEQETAASLDLFLSDVAYWSRYSFTYRIVHPSGEIQWLGSYGRNGELGFEDRDERLEWAEGWRVGVSEAASDRDEGSQAQIMATLNRDMDWACWAFGEYGWPSLSTTLPSSTCRTALLIPRSALHSSTIVPQALLLSVEETGATITIDEVGHVLVTNARTVKVHTADINNTSQLLKNYLPDTSFLELGTGAKFIAVATPSVAESAFPVALSLIPLAGRDSEQANIVLCIHELRVLIPAVQSRDVVIAEPSAKAFCFVGPHYSEDVTVQVGAPGGQLLLSPLHALAASDSESWKLAVLSPTVSALVEVLGYTGNTSPALPTPPPSPPPMMSSFPLDTPEASLRSIPPPLPMPTYQSLQSFAELPESKVETVMPLSPMSPGQTSIMLDDEPESLEVVQISEPTTEVAVAPTSVPPVNEGVLRIWFTWIFRLLVARMLSFIDISIRWCGFHSHPAGANRPSSPVDEESPQAHVTEAAAENTLVLEDKPKGTLPTLTEKALSTIQEEEVVPSQEHVPALDLDNAEDDATVCSEDQEADNPTEKTLEEDTLQTPIPLSFSSSVVTRAKPRFLAEVRSSSISLLVRAPHPDATLSELAVSVNEQRLEEGNGYSCSQLFSDVFLLSLQGSEGSSRLEVALD